MIASRLSQEPTPCRFKTFVANIRHARGNMPPEALVRFRNDMNVQPFIGQPSAGILLGQLPGKERLAHQLIVKFEKHLKWVVTENWAPGLLSNVSYRASRSVPRLDWRATGVLP